MLDLGSLTLEPVYLLSDARKWVADVQIGPITPRQSGWCARFTRRISSSATCQRKVAAFDRRLSLAKKAKWASTELAGSPVIA